MRAAMTATRSTPPHTRCAWIAALTSTALALASAPAAAAPGDLDRSFAGDGVQVTDIAGDRDQALALARQPNGRLVAAGVADEGTQDDNTAIARYLGTGALDSSFDTDGRLTTAFSPADQDAARAVAVQGDGRLVVAGYVGNGADMAVARYLPDGRLDPNFSSDGKREIDLGSSTNQDVAEAVAIQPDGRIVIAGRGTDENSDLAVVRLDHDGSLDGSFSGDGKRLIDIGEDFARDLAIQPDGRIVVAGTAAGGAADGGLPVRARPPACRWPPRHELLG